MSFANPKCNKVVEPLSDDGGKCCRTRHSAVCWRHDFLDYGSITAKTEAMAQLGGNGLILHSALVEPQNGQSLGLLWQNSGIGSQSQNHRSMKPQHRRKNSRKEAKPPFWTKSYKWVEALTTVENLVSRHTRVIHVFDRVGDITEVLLKFAILQHTGVIVRAHNRSLDSESERLWSKLAAQPISFEQEIELPQTQQRPAKLSWLYDFPVNLRSLSFWQPWSFSRLCCLCHWG